MLRNTARNVRKPILPTLPITHVLHINKKAPASSDAEASLHKNGGYLLSHGCAVPSARAGLTSLFGMGRGGTPPL